MQATLGLLLCCLWTREDHWLVWTLDMPSMPPKMRCLIDETGSRGKEDQTWSLAAHRWPRQTGSDWGLTGVWLGITGVWQGLTGVCLAITGDWRGVTGVWLGITGVWLMGDWGAIESDWTRRGTDARLQGVLVDLQWEWWGCGDRSKGVGGLGGTRC